MAATDILIKNLTDKGKDKVIAELLEQLDQKEKEIQKLNKEPKAPVADRETSNRFDCLAVTQVQVFPFRNSPNLGHIKALASVVLNDQLNIRGLRVMDGENGLFVGFPSDPFYRGEDFKSVVFPITKQLREHIENCVLEKFQHELDKGNFDEEK